MLFAEITRILNHILNITAFALDVGAITPFAVGLRGAREADGVLRARSAARACTRPISARAACIRTCRPGLADDICAWADAVPEGHRRSRGPADREPHLQAAHRRYRHRQRRGRARLGLHRPDAARLGRRLGSAQGAALRRLRHDGFRHPDRQERRLLRPLSRAHGGDAPVAAHHRAVRSTRCRAGR